MNGAQLMLEMLASAGVRYVFGNPGSTELPLTDAMVAEDRLEYILGLQEVPVMGIAEGYAQATRQPGVVNLHISPGLGNGLGMLYNAHRAGTPLVVTAGQQDRRLRFSEPILWGEMVEVARPWTKWSAEVQRVEDIPAAMRRAIQTALMPPTGPVFLSIPVDVQQQEAPPLDMTPPQPVNPLLRPPADELLRAVDVLATATNPAILAGSRVTESDAIAELVGVAEALGAPVISEPGTTHGRLGFPCTHPLSAPGLPLWAPDIHERLSEFDVILAVGLDVLRLYVYYEPERAIPEHIRLVHLDHDPWELRKNHATEVALCGGLKPGLSELEQQLSDHLTPAQLESISERRGRREAMHSEARSSLQAQASAELPRRPLTSLALMSSIAAALPPDIAVVEEAVTTTNTYLERRGSHRRPDWLLRPPRLGPGMGPQLRHRRPAGLARSPGAGRDGPEGASMYGIQGLWTAARYNIPVTFVIPNNAQYQILKVGARGIGLPTPPTANSSAWTWWNPRSTSWHWPDRWASKPAASPSLKSCPMCSPRPWRIRGLG
ncbi:MAG: benzoylformate decarboxylase [Planctomycetaceae bacterium]|nr:MAG: benzoylformate decarboxylase [Planctomycetaceae bacterium]